MGVFYKEAMTNRYWTYENLLLEFKKYRTILDVMKNSRAAYNKACKYGHLQNLKNDAKLSSKRIVTKQSIFEKALQYSDTATWRKYNQYDYQLCVKKGWLKDATAHMAKKYNRGVDIQYISSVVSQYSSLLDFRSEHPKMYRKIKKNGLSKLLSNLKRYSGSTT